MIRPTGIQVNREQIVDAMLVGHTLRGELDVWAEVGRFYKKATNPAVASAGTKLFRNVRKMVLRVECWRMALAACFYLRIYRWPVVRKKAWDLGEFWKVRFEAMYVEVEGQAQRLGLLVHPDKYDELVREMAGRRVELRLPRGEQEQRRAKVERFKATLRRMTPTDMSPVKEMSRSGSRAARELLENMTELGHDIRAYARAIVADLPAAERKQERKEIEALMKWAGWTE